MEERRRFSRTSADIRVELSHPSFGTLIGVTRDISDGGAQVVLDSSQSPPVGTVVQVLFKRVVGVLNADPVAMKVVHSHKNVLGLMFVSR
jgi:c-di-GMP-binding flagellar brake protein YcgR